MSDALGFFPELVFQHGLLSTSFHRVIFDDDERAVELLPSNRFKASGTFRVNYFAGGNIILKNAVQAYFDSFGIGAMALENETVWKLKPQFYLMPSARIYFQSDSRYFAPYGVHSPVEDYYTSDFDLSKFNTYVVGLGTKFLPAPRKVRRTALAGITVMYSYMKRSNALEAHIVSLSFLLQTNGNIPRRYVPQ